MILIGNQRQMNAQSLCLIIFTFNYILVIIATTVCCGALEPGR